MKTTEIKGTLEIDHVRGVIYFHLSEEADIQKYQMQTLLRICHLPKPIPVSQALDITHLVGTDWRGKL